MFCDKPLRDKLLEDYSTLRRGPRQGFVTEGPRQRFVTEGGGPATTRVLIHSHLARHAAGQSAILDKIGRRRIMVKWYGFHVGPEIFRQLWPPCLSKTLLDAAVCPGSHAKALELQLKAALQKSLEKQQAGPRSPDLPYLAILLRSGRVCYRS